MSPTPPSGSTLEVCRRLLRDIVDQEDLPEERVAVLAKTLEPEEAIGTPERRDFPIILGVERVIEATVRGVKGHAFTDSPGEFEGAVGEVLTLDLDTSRNRAVFVATLNAVLRYLGRTTGTVHCRDEDPERCSEEIASHLLERYGRVAVGLIGLNPAIAERLVETFGAEYVRITDLNADHIGQVKFGVEIWDGRIRTGDLIEVSGVLVVTGTTIVNGTFDDIQDLAHAAGIPCLVYGVTIAGVSDLIGFERLCPYGR
jgi:hypothetical protein